MPLSHEFSPEENEALDLLRKHCNDPYAWEVGEIIPWGNIPNSSYALEKEEPIQPVYKSSNGTLICLSGNLTLRFTEVNSFRPYQRVWLVGREHLPNTPFDE